MNKYVFTITGFVILAVIFLFTVKYSKAGDRNPGIITGIKKLSDIKEPSRYTKHNELALKNYFYDVSPVKNGGDRYDDGLHLDRLSIGEPASREEVLVVPGQEFTFAGKRRHTITGERPLEKTDLKPVASAIVGTVSLAAVIGIHINHQNAWWSEQGNSFKFSPLKDEGYSLHADKIGHFMGGYFVSYFSSEALTTVGVDWESSHLIGAVMGLGFQTYVEVLDGFNYMGFSTMDFGADILGAGFFYAQHKVEFLQNFTPKWQYTGLFESPKNLSKENLLDDYGSTNYWLSIDVHNILKEEMNWPSWLNFAVGYGVNGYNTSEMSGKFLVGLDYNLGELLPDGGSFWNWLKQSLNFIKLPSPSIEFGSKGIKFRILYPFSFDLAGIKF